MKFSRVQVFEGAVSNSIFSYLNKSFKSSPKVPPTEKKALEFPPKRAIAFETFMPPPPASK